MSNPLFIDPIRYYYYEDGPGASEHNAFWVHDDYESDYVGLLEKEEILFQQLDFAKKADKIRCLSYFLNGKFLVSNTIKDMIGAAHDVSAGCYLCGQYISWHEASKILDQPIKKCVKKFDGRTIIS